MKFDFDSALKAGYSEQEVAEFLASQSQFDLEEATKNGYSYGEVIGFLGKAPPPAPTPPPEETIDYAQFDQNASSTAPPAPAKGLIQRVGDFLRPAPKSVMDSYQTTPQERKAEIKNRLALGAGPISQTAADLIRKRQAEIKNRLALGAGPISQKTVAAAKLVRSGITKSDSALVNKVAQKLPDSDFSSFGEMAARAKAQVSEESLSAGEWALDTLSSLGQASISLVQLPTNFISPSSPLAQTLRDTQKELQDQESDVLKAQREELRRRVESEDGFLGEYVATVIETVTNPSLGISEAVKQVPNFLGVLGVAKLGASLFSGAVSATGKLSPMLALSEAISGRVIQTAARSAGSTAGGVAAASVLTAGDAAGSVYEKLVDPKQTSIAILRKNPDFQKLVESGLSEQDARIELATTKARFAAVVAAPLGLLGFAGAEASLAARGVRGAAKDAATVGGAAKIFGKEFVGEQLEEGGTQFVGNLVNRTVDPKQDLTEGVAQAAATAAVTSAPFSAAAVGAQVSDSLRQPLEDTRYTGLVTSLLDTNTYDPTLIDPRQTSRPVNFTPPDSPTAKAGLPPIVVPTRTETADVSRTDALGGLAAGSPAIPSRVDGGSLDGTGLPPIDTTGTGLDANAGGAVPRDGAAVPARTGASEQLAPLTLPRLAERTSDTELLSRVRAALPETAQAPATAPAQNNNAVVQPTPAIEPVTVMERRDRKGYDTPETAVVAMQVGQKRQPELAWQVEQTPEGRFRVAAYEPAALQAVAPAPVPEAVATPVPAPATPASPVQTRQTIEQITTEITGDDARALVAGKTEKPGGVDPVRQIVAAEDNQKVLRVGSIPLEMFAPNQDGDRYDGTVDIARARDYASRPAETAPPVIAVVSPRTGLLNIIDGGNRISAARLRGDTEISAIVSLKPPTPAAATLTAPTAQAEATPAITATAAPVASPAPAVAEPITTPSGTPFSTAQTATVFAQQNGISDFATEPVDGGFVIRPAAAAPAPAVAAPEATTSIAPTVTPASAGSAPTNPVPFSERDTAPAGTWMKLDIPDLRGQPVAQIREIPVDDLYVAELTEDGRLQPEKRSYLPGYVDRIKAGDKAPAVDVIEMEDGRLRVVDGARRVMAARAAGQATVRAVVSPLIDTPEGKVGLTVELAQAQTPAATAAPTATPITAPSGKPFSTPQVAEVFARQNGITGYSTVQVQGGYAIQPTEATNGQPAGQVAGRAGTGVGQQLAQGIQSAPVDGGDGALQLADRPGIPAVQAGAAATRQSQRVDGPTQALKLAPTAPLKALGVAIRAAERSSKSPVKVYDQPLNIRQQVASAIGQMLGNTVTFLQSAKPAALSNGFVVGDAKNIYIASDSDDAPLSVVFHEGWHTLPEEIKARIKPKLLDLFRQERRGEFAREFEYDILNDKLIDEEIPAFMVQAISKQPEFLTQLREKLGDGDFAEFARLVLAKFNEIIGRVNSDYGQGFADKYISDVVAARELLASAYAEAVRDAEGIVEEVARSNPDATDTEYQAAAKPALQAAIKGSTGDDRQAAGQDGQESADQQGLTSYSPEEVIARQDAAAQADAATTRAEAVATRAEAAARPASEIAQQSVAAADTFELGGDALDNLTGQEGLFESRRDGKNTSKVDAAPAGQELIALHNLSVENLLYADEIGGLPVPSIGITKAATPFSGFGEITLIAPKSMIDPANGAPVFDRDAWTARFPDMKYKNVQAKRADAFYERMAPAKAMGDDGKQFMSMLWEGIKNDRVQSPNKVADLFTRYDAPRIMYAKEVLGRDIKVPMRDARLSYPFASDKELRSFWSKNSAAIFKADRDMSGPDFYGSSVFQEFSQQVKSAISRGFVKEDRNEKTIESLRKMYLDDMFDESGTLFPSNYTMLKKDLEKVGTKEIDGSKLRDAVRKVVPDNDPAYLSWVTGQVKPLFDAPTITVGGRQVAPTLDNIVQAMTTGTTQGAEKSMTFGAGKAAALLGKQFKSMDEIKAARDQVVSQKQEQEAKTSTDTLLNDYRTKVLQFFTQKDYRGNVDTWAGMDAAMEALTIAGRGTLTDGNLRVALQRKGFRSLDGEALSLARQSIEALRSAATDYFEAKPQRAVALNEFVGALVPKGVDPKAMEVLEKNGIQATEFNPKKEGDREAKLSKLAKKLDKDEKVLFSNRLKAYHGTPYRGIEKFSTDNIGTGEGAQAYGWGLYFASKKEIAEYYRETLTNRDSQGYANAHLNAKNLVERLNGDVDWATETLTDQINNTEPSDPNYRRLTDTLEMVKSGAYAKPLASPGQLYQVSVPSDTEMLLWDKPLSEQPAKVREALEKLDLIDSSVFGEYTGQQLYEGQVRDGVTFDNKARSDAQRETSLALAAAGIKGIKYLDGVSRNKTLKDIKRDFLNELPEDAEFDEVLDLVGTGTFKPAHEAIITALADIGWLGFDYPSQAISAALSANLSANYDPSPELIKAVSDAQDEGTYNYVVFSGDDVEIENVFYSNRLKQTTETPEFKRWFADSKVVDAEGMPLVVYHGTAADFEVFNTTGGDGKTFDTGAFFTASAATANTYAPGVNRGSVVPVFLSLQKPLVLDAGGANWDNIAQKAKVKLPAIDAVDPTLQADEDLLAELEGRPAVLLGPVKKKARSTNVRALFEGEWDYPDDTASTDDIARWARRAGYDGVVITNVKDQGSVGSFANDNSKAPGTIYVAFRPEQIKSATGNNGNFDPANPKITESKRQQPIQGQQFYLKGETRRDATRIALQDYFLRVKRVQDAIAAQGGTVGEAQDVYMAETLSYGRLQEQLMDFKEKTVKPLIADVKKAGLELSDLSLYAYAMHAKERNAAMQAINPKVGDSGSGMTDKEADDILDAFKKEGQDKALADLHNKLLAITSTTRLVMLDEGLITQEEYDAYEAAYENYVPLRGFVEDEQDEVTGRPISAPRVGGKGFNIRGAETMRALGRTSKAGHIIENIVGDYERVIARAERNNVAKVFLDLVTTNPDPKLWEIDAARTSISLDKSSGMVKYNQLLDKGEDTVSAKIDGNEVYIKVKDPLLLRALRQSSKDETGAATRMLVKWLGWYTNLMRNTLTRYNPAFGFTNAVKDIGFGAVSAMADLGPKAVLAYLKNYATNLQRGKLWEEFRAAGSTTGGWQMRDPKEMQKELERLVAYGGGNGVKSTAYNLGVSTLNALEWIGMASENQARFAAYKTAREMGLSPSRAGVIAKELTANFNRKGEWGAAMNTLYLFFNAGVQGSAKTLKNLKSPWVMGAMTGLAGLSAGLALYGASAGGDDEDGEAYWDKIPDFEKEKNLIIMLPPGEGMLIKGEERVGTNGRYIKIPIQYGLNVFSTLGHQVAGLIRNAEDSSRGTSPAQAAKNMVSVTFGAFNPFGGAVDITDPIQAGMAAAPSIGDLGIQFSAGVNGFGRPVAPVRSPYDSRPDSENFGPNMAGTWEQRLARWMNAQTGGNQEREGGIDVAPGTIRNVVQNATGGTGDFLSSVLVNIPSKLWSPEHNVGPRDLPVLKAFYGEVDDTIDNRLYYERKAKVMEAAETASREQKAGIRVDVDEDTRGLISLGTAAKMYTKEMRLLRKEEIEIAEDPDLTAAEKVVKRRDVAKRIAAVSREFNAEFVQMRKDLARGEFAQLDEPEEDE